MMELMLKINFVLTLVVVYGSFFGCRLKKRIKALDMACSVALLALSFTMPTIVVLYYLSLN